MTLEKDISFEMDEKSVAMFMFSSQYGVLINISVKTGQKSNSNPFFTQSSVFIQGESVSLRNLAPHTLNVIIWVVPQEICPRAGIFFYSKDSIYFRMVLNRPNTRFCMFSIANESSMTTISTTPHSNDKKITFYQQSSISGTYSPFQCTNGCSFAKKSPFFVSFEPIYGEHTEIEFRFVGFMKSQWNHTCLVDTIPYILPESMGTVYPGGSPSNMVCSETDRTDDIVLIIVIISFFIVSIIAVLIYAFPNILPNSTSPKADEGYLISHIEEDHNTDVISESLKKPRIDPNLLRNIQKFL